MQDRIIGSYTGQTAQEFTFPEFLASLCELRQQLLRPQNRVLYEVRNRTVCVPLPAPGGGTLMAAVKAFARPSLMMDLTHHWRGSKARRSFVIAQFLTERGLGSPRPLAFLERWSGGRLIESYFVTEFQAEAVDARHELIRLFRDEQKHDDGRRLLERIAVEVRALHAAGVQHNDLGHQNILVCPSKAGTRHLQFIDLNRARIRGRLSVRQRAGDLARLWCPSPFRPTFLSAYFGGAAVPAEFFNWMRVYKAISLIRKHSRALRHPVRERRLRMQSQQPLIYPSV